MTHFKAFAIVAISAIVLGLNLGITAESRAQSSPQEAARFVESLGSQAAVLLASGKVDGPGKRRSALRSLIRDSFDLEQTSQFVLGKFWNKATLEQRAEFQDLFTEYLLNNYARHIGTYKAETLVVVASNVVGDRDVMVETKVESAEGSTSPVWRVRASDSGQYRIIDVSVDGVSLALTQRREFASVAAPFGGWQYTVPLMPSVCSCGNYELRRATTARPGRSSPRCPGWRSEEHTSELQSH